MFSRLFKKNPSQNEPVKPNNSQRRSKIIIGVPGKWNSRDDIIGSLFPRGYLLVGPMLKKADTEKNWRIEIYDRDPNLRQAFQNAGGGLLEDNLLSEIEVHTFTVYVSSFETSIEAARDIQEVGCALLNSGGLAIKVESSGLAHSATTWQELSSSDNLWDLIKSFVVIVSTSDAFLTCGMHNFRFPDCSISRSGDNAETIKQLNYFNYFQLSQNPVLKERETFDLGENSPVYRLSKISDDLYPPEHNFHNFNGRSLDKN